MASNGSAFSALVANSRALETTGRAGRFKDVFFKTFVRTLFCTLVIVLIAFLLSCDEDCAHRVQTVAQPLPGSCHHTGVHHPAPTSCRTDVAPVDHHTPPPLLRRRSSPLASPPANPRRPFWVSTLLWSVVKRVRTRVLPRALSWSSALRRRLVRCIASYCGLRCCGLPPGAMCNPWL